MNLIIFKRKSKHVSITDVPNTKCKKKERKKDINDAYMSRVIITI